MNPMPVKFQKHLTKTIWLEGVEQVLNFTGLTPQSLFYAIYLFVLENAYEVPSIQVMSIGGHCSISGMVCT